jgi:hypothetical protein
MVRPDHAAGVAGASLHSYDGAMDAAELIPLARAAALAYGRLFPDERVKDAKTLDLLAVAISARVPLFCQQDKENVRAVEQAELARGRFTRGAARLEFGDRPPLRFLLVPRRELTPAIDSIAKDALLAATLSRPRRPAYSSARGA